MAVINSVVTSGKSRLRPVLMTTATTVLGMIPMAIGGGQGSEMWSPMAIAVIGGLTVSTVLTPVSYTHLAIRYVSSVLLTEINSVTDNPTIFPDEDRIISGGNFHGQP